MEISSMAMLPQVLELGLGEAPRQVALLDVLDQVPADAQVQGHVADGHAAPQLQGVSLEGGGVAAPRVGEGDLDLADHAAGLAFDAGDGQDHERGAAADGQGAEAALDLAARSGPAGDPQAEQRQVSGSWWMVKIIWPPW